MNTMRKILAITHQLSRTGAPIVLLDLLRLCQSLGYQVDMITMQDGELAGEVADLGIEYRVQERFFNEREAFVREASQYDLVIANTLITYEAIHCLNGTTTPVIWWLHEGRQYFEYFSTVLPDFARLSPNIHVLSVGHYVADVIRDIYNYETEILHFPLKNEADAVKPHSTPNDGTHTVRFLTSGTYSAVKAQDVLAAAIRLLPAEVMDRTEFLFCGNETMVDENVFASIKALAADYGNVKLLHQLSHGEVLSYMKSSDCLIIPSRIDPIPTVAVEMLMLGGLCLCTDICGIAHYIQDGVNGFTVPPDDAQALADKICNIVNLLEGDEKETVEKIRLSGRSIYEEHFSPEVIQPQMTQLLYSLTGLPSPGALPGDFLEDEVRNDFLVKTNTKKVWKAELEILAMFDDLCRRNNLHYCIDYGTLLGAVRHKGFIPWDDDIDVSMLRPDYERLKEIAPRELSAPYVYQNMYNDRLSFAFSKIRNSNTSAIEFPDIDPSVNQGIFIDIFPMDSVPLNKQEPTMEFKMQWELLLIVDSPQGFLEKIKGGYQPALTMDLISQLVKLPTQEVFRYFEEFSTSKFGYTDYVDKLVPWQQGKPMQWYANPTYLPFENLYLPAPLEYEKLLTIRYGEKYMEFPEVRHPNHYIKFDADKPYRYYMDNHLIPG
jgi:phosphorylcholine metabolism protein LicD/glycosyltransferase involved in cell wall biosynthesis